MAFNVLIVDDSSSMRAVIKKIIRVSGFNVGTYFEAGDGREALTMLANEWIDLVLTDINMPNMNGLELVSVMKADGLFRSIPVVVVTTEGGERKVQEAGRLGACGYIKKPFLPADIKNTLSRIMKEEDDNAAADVGSDEAGDF